MTCKEAEKMIPGFLEDSLTEDELADFLHHIETCEVCKEELSIQLLISEGMDRLEYGSSFNLQESVERKLDLGQNRIRTGTKLKNVLYVLEILILCGLGICLWLCFYAGK